MQWPEVVLEMTTFSFFQSFGGNFGCKSEKSKRRTFFKEVEIIEKADVRVHTTLILNGNSIRAIFFRR